MRFFFFLMGEGVDGLWKCFFFSLAFIEIVSNRVLLQKMYKQISFKNRLAQKLSQHYKSTIHS